MISTRDLVDFLSSASKNAVSLSCSAILIAKLSRISFSLEAKACVLRSLILVSSAVMEEGKWSMVYSLSP